MSVARPPRVLIVGASGQIGHHLARAVERLDLPWAGTFHSYPVPGLRLLDVRDHTAVARLVEECEPSFVLMPAAATRVDSCEIDARQAYEVNVFGTGHVVDAADAVGATVVYFSTDYVFDGREGPYTESASPNPLSQYGAQKLVAESRVQHAVGGALIVRTTVVYGFEPQSKNFVARLLGDLRRGERVTVPSDQIGTPTHAPDLAEAVIDLMMAGARGVVNVAGNETVARDEFAREVARVFGEDPALVCPALTAELGQPAPRPLRAGLRVDYAERLLGRELPGYRAGLREMAALIPYPSR